MQVKLVFPFADCWYKSLPKQGEIELELCSGDILHLSRESLVTVPMTLEQARELRGVLDEAISVCEEQRAKAAAEG